MARFRRKPWLRVLPVLAVCLAFNVCFIQSFNYSAFGKQGLKEFLIVCFWEIFLAKHFLIAFAFAHSRLFKTSRQEFGPQRRRSRSKTTSTICVLQVGLRGCYKRRPRSWGVLVQCISIPRWVYQKQRDCGQGWLLGGTEKCDALEQVHSSTWQQEPWQKSDARSLSLQNGKRGKRHTDDGWREHEGAPEWRTLQRDITKGWRKKQRPCLDFQEICGKGGLEPWRPCKCCRCRREFGQSGGACCNTNIFIHYSPDWEVIKQRKGKDSVRIYRRLERQRQRNLHCRGWGKHSPTGPTSDQLRVWVTIDIGTKSIAILRDDHQGDKRCKRCPVQFRARLSLPTSSLRHELAGYPKHHHRKRSA